MKKTNSTHNAWWSYSEGELRVYIYTVHDRGCDEDQVMMISILVNEMAQGVQNQADTLQYLPHLHRPLLRSKTSDTGPASQLGLVAWKAASKTRSRMLSQVSNLLSYDPNSSQSTKYPRKPPRHQKSKMKRPVVHGWNLWRLAGPGQECRLKAKYAWEGSHPCGGLFDGVCAYIAQARIQLYWSCCSWQYVHK